MNQNGFSLVELMIACGVFCVILLGFISFMYQQSHQGSSTNNRQSQIQIKSGIQSALKSSDTIVATDNAQLAPLPDDPSTAPIFTQSNTADAP